MQLPGALTCCPGLLQVYREALLLSHLKHPNIVSFYGMVLESSPEMSGRKELRVGLVMELCDCSLQDLLDSSTDPLALPQALNIALGIATGQAGVNAASKASDYAVSSQTCWHHGPVLLADMRSVWAAVQKWLVKSAAHQQSIAAAAPSLPWTLH